MKIPDKYFDSIKYSVHGIVRYVDNNGDWCLYCSDGESVCEVSEQLRTYLCSKDSGWEVGSKFQCEYHTVQNASRGAREVLA